MRSESKSEAQNSFLITVDVEDWFQVENFKSCIAFDQWQNLELRVSQNVHRMLDLLDNIKATFFVLGWVAQRVPHLVKTIRARGHEIASHGYHHALCSRLSAHELAEDLKRSKKLLEDITGAPVSGYRAPSFSVSPTVLKIIADCGFNYDSSYNSFGLNARYGQLPLPENGNRNIAHRLGSGFFELPISNLAFGAAAGKGLFKNKPALKVPIGGGAYFRLMPFPFFKSAVDIFLKRHDAYLFYIHPWELDPGQPRVMRASRLSKIRHYSNLGRTHDKLRRLISTFKACRFTTCTEYLRQTT